MRSYEYKHIVGFEETNLLGNVYFTNFFHWQGRCREMFLRDHVPDLLDNLRNDLYLATTHSSCEFLAEAFAFDEIIVRMSLARLSQSRITMSFEFVRVKSGMPAGNEFGKETLLARGEQQVVCMKHEKDRVEVVEVPANIVQALKLYQHTSP